MTEFESLYFEQNLIENNEEKHQYGAIGLASEDNKTDFYITFSECSWMDKINPCFGRLYPYDPNSESFAVLKILENSLTLSGGRPSQRLFISQCGQM